MRTNPRSTRRARAGTALAASLLALALAGCGGKSQAVGSLPIITESTSSTSTGGEVSGTTAGMPASHAGTSTEAMPGMPMRQVAETTWQGMRIAAAFMPAVKFSIWNGTRQQLVKPTPSENVHLMIVLSDAQTGERIPYASVAATITGPDRKVVYSNRQWPMLSRSMGMHYGNDLSLPKAGHYMLKLLIGPPAVGRHPEYQKVWLVPHTVELPFDWAGGF